MISFRAYYLGFIACSLFVLACFGCAGGGTDGTGLNVRVAGTVVDVSSTPVAGIDIVVQETGASTKTNEHGEFILNSPEGGTLLIAQAEFSLSALAPEVRAVAILFELDTTQSEVKVIEVVIEEVDPTPVSPTVLPNSPQTIAPTSAPPAEASPTPAAPSSETPIRAPTVMPSPSSAPEPTPTPAVNLTTTPTATSIPPTATPQPGHPRGDMNCDGVVNCSDADGFVLAILSGQAAYEAAYPNCDFMLADVNNDGVVNNFDSDAFAALTGPC